MRAKIHRRTLRSIRRTVSLVASSLLLFLSAWPILAQVPFTITTNSPLSNGAIGAFYTVTFSATGSTAIPFSWSIISGTPPPGVDLNGFNGTLSGTPASPGSYNFTIQVADATGLVTSKAFSMTVVPLTVTTLTPASIIRGGGGVALNLIVDGSGFVPFDPECAGSIVRWNGNNLTTSFSSSTRLQATVTTDLIAQPGSATVDVLNLNQCGTDATSNSVVFNIYNPTAAIASIDPTNANPGSPPFTLTVTGSNFLQGAFVRWNGANLTTTFVRNGVLTARVPSANLLNPGTASITVFNPLSAGDSNSVPFTVNNPLPTVTALSPQSIQFGNRVFLLTVTGTNFVNGSTVLWNGNARDTTFVSSTQLTAVIPTSDVAVPGTSSVSVSNPNPGGGTSNSLTFTVAGILPKVSALNPQSIQVGSPAFTLTVTGSNFVTGSVVLWNGNNRSTTFVSSAQLTAQILATDVAVVGSVSVSVSNPSPGGGTSNTVAFSVSSAPVVITTSDTLADGFVGVAYSGPIAAEGGVPPYAWSISGGILPAGMTLNASTGLISGTPTDAGSFAFTVQVLDSVEQAASKRFSLLINPLPSTFTITGVSDTALPGQQISAGVSLNSAYTILISGKLLLTVTADVDDPAIQFATGGRTVDFSIPAGTTQAVFPGNVNQIGFQTGTVVSTIKLSVTAQVSGQALPLNPDPARSLTVERKPPVITSVAFGSQSSSGFSILVTGFASSRSVTQSTFDFSPKPGTNFQQTSISVNVGSAFETWFSSQNSLTFGSEFLLTVPFTVQGDASTIGSVTVRLTNADGTSDPKSASR